MFRKALSPVVYILGSLNTLLYRLLKIPTDARVTKEEVRIVARLGVEHGSIEYREHEMIMNVFRFNDVTAGGIMTPLYRVVSVDVDDPISDVATEMTRAGLSRFPVYEETEEHIIGYVHVSQIMRAFREGRNDESIELLVQSILSISENVTVERVFRKLKRGRTHICLVHETEDKSKVIGICTMEDVIEEVMGDIEDETDK